MFKVGVYFGKFLPCHRGHLAAIINASTQCEKLYVVVSDNPYMTSVLCNGEGLKDMSGRLRVQWLSQELQDIQHIKVILLDETGMPEPPNGWRQWTDALRALIPEKVDAFFIGENEYVNKLRYYFPASECILYDFNRTKYPISATEIRRDPMRHWDYILGSARPFFAKKILIAGTESCGKTTLVKYLAKLYHTSWSEEVGRHYAQKYLGGNESVFTDVDFMRIAHLQYEQDYETLRHANKVAFFDTDATVTQYYSNLYMGHTNDDVQRYIDSERYDLVILLNPDVKWVDDGMRLNGEQQRRLTLHSELKNMYVSMGFGDKIVEISGNYNQRLERSCTLIDAVIGKK